MKNALILESYTHTYRIKYSLTRWDNFIKVGNRDNRVPAPQPLIGTHAQKHSME